MMNQTNKEQFNEREINWQQALDSSKRVSQGLYKILKGLGRYAWSSLKRNASNRLKVFIIALVVSLLYIIPFLTSNGALYGDDLHFHIDRMLGLATIKESPVNFKSFYKVGQGINFFYPYLTYYPYYLLYKHTNSLYAGWMIYIYLLTIVTYLISYYSCEEVPTILSDSGATTIHFPAGQHKVKITYEYTPMAKVAHAHPLWLC